MSTTNFPTVARWIQAPPPGDRDRFRAPILFTDLTVPDGLRAAELRVCGLGLQHVTVDGAPVNDHRLDPPFTDFDHRVLYVTAEITDLLTVGEHRLSITLGRGFFAVPTGNVWHWHRAPWSGPLRAIAELRLTFADGSTRMLGTDETWSATLDRTTYDCYYAGESYDATLPIPDPTPAVPADPPKGPLHPAGHEPIRVTWQGTPTWERVGDSWVADFGRTIAGWTGLRSDQQRDAAVTITYAEKRESDGTLQPRSVHVDGDRFQTDTYVGDGTRGQYWEPRFSYKGFRYVQLDGLSHEPAADTLTAYAAHNDVTAIGEFSCGEPLFETFTAAMARTIENNLHHIPTDTPVYEKNGWTGDAQLGLITMTGLFDIRRLMIKWLDDLRDAQHADGWLPVIAPTAGWGYTDLGPSPEWTTVYPHLLRELYRRCGDLDLVADHWPSLTRYLEWELGRLVHGVAVSQLGDYLQPGTDGVGPDDSGVTASALLIRALRDSAELAEMLGVGSDHQRFAAAARDLTAAMNDRFLDRDLGRYDVGPVYSQTSNALPLLFGLVPEDLVGAVVANLVADIEQRDDHLNVGCIGANCVLPALTAHGHGELAFRVARQTSYPSWGFWFANGADTMWEMWETSARSRDHYFHGTVVQWLIEDIAGLRCGDHGWRTVTVQPHPLGGLDHASYAIRTIRGRVGVAWRREGERFSLEVEIPEGSTATVLLPGTADQPTGPVIGPTRREFTSRLA
ncbi:alpha-L-rhamnosidase [Microlunatus sp. Gsoil 973]|uniref:alpha-L-rhamnosidase n=1 Tax=Microlunatus sp. Gsoil 973 TaxID=2672569 RepID=UPI0012B465EB|nr:alpha-L-rhamnosidase [Microlunatus sp. Gsoil 973]QGN31532.1 Bacterial alpha-L-rhamnosidase [Microlunatus sp. Gsoil 973]